MWCHITTSLDPGPNPSNTSNAIFGVITAKQKLDECQRVKGYNPSVANSGYRQPDVIWNLCIAMNSNPDLGSATLERVGLMQASASRNTGDLPTSERC